MRPASFVPGAALLAVLLLLPFTPALAQGSKEERMEQHIQSFHFSDTAYIQEPQQLQLQLGGLWWKRTGDDSFELPLSLEFGASERFEFDGEVDFSFPQPNTGNLRAVERASAGVMMALVDSRASGVAVTAGLAFVGSRDSLDNSFDPGAAPSLSAIAQRGMFIANVELSMDIISRNSNVDLTPEAALGLALDLGRVQPVLEAVYENDESATGIFAAGLRFHPTQSLELGAAVPLEVSGGETHVGFTTSVVLELGGS
ncbi:hypothetical protein FGE12_04430 [Aggregicoccus sp. 17bor-14]|uniref:hypothetical protein n=1 Tax=Myxococcaceae TaxID=31 RepID=UPI00129D02E3|nr:MULTISPECIES: hypothetical protein [Myxococcaceae]MBF5041623.1 hypothetical protein [Simulacricoccus sp. 17bor-14]MRI87408.1 hypothetical protein [Aggregicoccus sp. 17bor-14]